MARPRIQQFADDMGISYDEAKKLINKGRGRTDGGSQVLESNMRKMTVPKPKPKMMKPTPKPKDGELNQRQAMEDMRKNPPQYDMDEEQREILRRQSPKNKAMGGTVFAEDGKYMSCRGAGKAIQGTKFTGTK
tara:strand:+ start:67 stop:465 length:399 start_codon:yes stop_codon:yes gene_type:complete